MFIFIFEPLKYLSLIPEKQNKNNIVGSQGILLHILAVIYRRKKIYNMHETKRMYDVLIRKNGGLRVWLAEGQGLSS